MILTIRKTGGSTGTEEVLGTVDAMRLDEKSRRTLVLQLENLTDLTSGH